MHYTNESYTVNCSIGENKRKKLYNNKTVDRNKPEQQIRLPPVGQPVRQQLFKDWSDMMEAEEQKSQPEPNKAVTSPVHTRTELVLHSGTISQLIKPIICRFVIGSWPLTGAALRSNLCTSNYSLPCLRTKLVFT